jgi:hypothetical protein
MQPATISLPLTSMCAPALSVIPIDVLAFLLPHPFDQQVYFYEPWTSAVVEQ